MNHSCLRRPYYMPLVILWRSSIWLVEIDTSTSQCYLTYLLHWAVHLEKLTCFQLVKKFYAFYENRRFITVFTNARRLPLSWVTSIQSPHSTSWRFILLLTPIYAWVSQVVPFFRFPHHNPVCTCPLPISATCHAHPILIDFITRTILGEQYRSLSSSSFVVSSNPLSFRTS
jgi:hypothetical protein